VNVSGVAFVVLSKRSLRSEEPVRACSRESGRAARCGPLLSLPKGRVLRDAIIARLARFLIKLTTAIYCFFSDSLLLSSIDINSTSKMSVEPGPISAPAPRSP